MKNLILGALITIQFVMVCYLDFILGSDHPAMFTIAMNHSLVGGFLIYEVMIAFKGKIK